METKNQSPPEKNQPLPRERPFAFHPQINMSGKGVLTTLLISAIIATAKASDMQQLPQTNNDNREGQDYAEQEYQQHQDAQQYQAKYEAPPAERPRAALEYDFTENRETKKADFQNFQEELTHHNAIQNPELQYNEKPLDYTDDTKEILEKFHFKAAPDGGTLIKMQKDIFDKNYSISLTSAENAKINNEILKEVGILTPEIKVFVANIKSGDIYSLGYYYKTPLNKDYTLSPNTNPIQLLQNPKFKLPLLKAMLLGANPFENHGDKEHNIFFKRTGGDIMIANIDSFTPPAVLAKEDVQTLNLTLPDLINLQEFYRSEKSMQLIHKRLNWIRECSKEKLPYFSHSLKAGVDALMENENFLHKILKA